MALVTTTNCSILLIGDPSKTFKPSRGLRQGDPLSPFLFILMMEGLGRAIRVAKEEGRIQGLRLTHDISIQRNFSNILGFQRETLPVKYLGVPLTDNPLHKDIWDPILNKLKDKINKRTNRALNLARGLVLTKVVLQSIPIYMLSTIPAPVSVMNNIRKMQRDFLWGKSEEKKQWALVAWDRWRWLKEIQAPWVKLWKHKYASKWQEENLIRMTGQVKGSAIWCRAWENRAVVQNHCFWEIRNGNLAWFWEDN
eukprot:PITA_10732